MTRRKIIRNRRELFLPTAGWILELIYVNLFSPSKTVAVIFFYILTGVAFYFTFKVFSSVQKSLFRSLTVILFMVLRQMRLDSPITVIILITLFFTLEFYFRKS